MVKVTYEVSDDRIRQLLVQAAKNDATDVCGFSWNVRYIVSEAFEAGRDFQKRLKEEED